jgi:apolipoprotein D and lipocalin family protein
MRALLNSTLAALVTLSAAASIALGDTAKADLAVVSAATSALPVVQTLDLQRYSGTWFEQARLPNRFQRECAGNVMAEYAVAEGGALKVVNGCTDRQGGWSRVEGEGRRVPVVGAPQGQLEVRFAPRWLSWLSAVWGDYWVIGIDDSYSTALVGTPDREYLWLLSRAPVMPQAEVRQWLDRAASAGFAIDKVVLTPQGGDAVSKR